MFLVKLRFACIAPFVEQFYTAASIVDSTLYYPRCINYMLILLVDCFMLKPWTQRNQSKSTEEVGKKATEQKDLSVKQKNW